MNTLILNNQPAHMSSNFHTLGELHTAVVKGDMTTLQLLLDVANVNQCLEVRYRNFIYITIPSTSCGCSMGIRYCIMLLKLVMLKLSIC